MQLTTPTYMTSFNVELTNPVFVTSNVFIRSDNSVQINLENKAYTETQNTLGDYINYQMLIFANQASFDAEAESLPYKDSLNRNTWGFRIDDTEVINEQTVEIYAGMTVEQAIYHHFKNQVMTSHTFSDIDLGMPSLQA